MFPTPSSGLESSPSTLHTGVSDTAGDTVNPNPTTLYLSEGHPGLGPLENLSLPTPSPRAVRPSVGSRGLDPEIVLTTLNTVGEVLRW